MTHHYYILVETVDAHLSRGMRQLNGLFTQRFNQCHGLVGHLFQGRYKAILLALSLEEYRQRFQTHDAAMTAAYLSGAYRMAEIASF